MKDIRIKSKCWRLLQTNIVTLSLLLNPLTEVFAQTYTSEDYQKAHEKLRKDYQKQTFLSSVGQFGVTLGGEAAEAGVAVAIPAFATYLAGAGTAGAVGVGVLTAPVTGPALLVAGSVVVATAAISTATDHIKDAIQEKTEMVLVTGIQKYNDMDIARFREDFEDAKKYSDDPKEILVHLNGGVTPSFMLDMDTNAQQQFSQAMVQSLGNTFIRGWTINASKIAQNEEDIMVVRGEILDTQQGLDALAETTQQAVEHLYGTQTEIIETMGNMIDVLDNHEQRIDTLEKAAFLNMSPERRVAALRQSTFMPGLLGEKRDQLLLEATKASELAKEISSMQDFSQHFNAASTILGNFGVLKANPKLAQAVNVAQNLIGNGIAAFASFSMGNPLGMMQGIASLSSMLGTFGGGKSAEQKQFEAIMQMMNALMENQKRMLANQKAMLDNQKIIMENLNVISQQVQGVQKTADAIQIAQAKIDRKFSKFIENFDSRMNELDEKFAVINSKLDDIIETLIGIENSIDASKVNNVVLMSKALQNNLGCKSIMTNDLMSTIVEGERRKVWIGLPIPILYEECHKLNSLGDQATNNYYQGLADLHNLVSDLPSDDHDSIFKKGFLTQQFSPSDIDDRLDTFIAYYRAKSSGNQDYFQNFEQWLAPIYNFNDRDRMKFSLEKAESNSRYSPFFASKEGFETDYHSLMNKNFTKPFSSRSVAYFANLFVANFDTFKALGTSRDRLKNIDEISLTTPLPNNQAISLRKLASYLYIALDITIAQQHLGMGLNIFEFLYEDVLTINERIMRINEAVYKAENNPEFKQRFDSVVQTTNENLTKLKKDHVLTEGGNPNDVENISILDDNHLTLFEWNALQEVLETVQEEFAQHIETAFAEVDTEYDPAQISQVQEMIDIVMQDPILKDRFVAYIQYRSSVDGQMRSILPKGFDDLALSNLHLTGAEIDSAYEAVPSYLKAAQSFYDERLFVRQCSGNDELIHQTTYSTNCDPERGFYTEIMLLNYSTDIPTNSLREMNYSFYENSVVNYLYELRANVMAAMMDLDRVNRYDSKTLDILKDYEINQYLQAKTSAGLISTEPSTSAEDNNTPVEEPESNGLWQKIKKLFQP